jgi:Flp pilus assembly protein TadD
MAAYYFARGEQRKALGILEDYTRAYPRSYDGLYNYSVLLYRCGNVQKAARIISRLLTFDEKNLKTLLTAGEISGAAEDLNLLHRVMEALERCHPDSWRGSCFRGVQLATRYNDLQRAEQCFHKAICLQPAIPEVYVHLAYFLTLRQNFASALQALITARSRIPDDECRTHSAQIAILTAQTYRRMGKRDRENKWLKQGLTHAELLVKSEPAVGYYWKGKILQKMDDSTTSHEMFRQALGFAPFFPLNKEINEILAKNRKAALKS